MTVNQKLLFFELCDGSGNGQTLRAVATYAGGALHIDIEGHQSPLYLGMWEGQAELVVSPDCRTDEAMTIKLCDARPDNHNDDSNTDSPWTEAMRLVDRINPRPKGRKAGTYECSHCGNDCSGECHAKRYSNFDY